MLKYLYGLIKIITNVLSSVYTNLERVVLRGIVTVSIFVYAFTAPTNQRVSHDSIQVKVSDFFIWLKHMANKRIAKQFTAPKELDPMSVNRIKLQDLTNDMFYKLTDGYKKPLVITDVVKDHNILKNKWTSDKLKDLLKDTIVPVTKDNVLKNMFNDPNAFFNKIKHSENDELFFENMTYGNYCEKLKNNEKYYLLNLAMPDPILDSFNKDFQIDDLTKTFPILGTRIGCDMFIGRDGSGTPLHCEQSASFGYQIKGSKVWYLVDQEYDDAFESIPSTMRVNYITQHTFSNNNSKVARSVPHYKVQINENEMLYFPRLIWHETQNIGNNIMFSTRMEPPTIHNMDYANIYPLIYVSSILAHAYNTVTKAFLKPHTTKDINELGTSDFPKMIENEIATKVVNDFVFRLNTPYFIKNFNR